MDPSQDHKEVVQIFQTLISVCGVHEYTKYQFPFPPFFFFFLGPPPPPPPLFFWKFIGASLSEPHIDELNVRNLYIMYIYIMYGRTSVTRAPPYTLYSNSRYSYSGGRMKKLLRSPVPRAQSLLSQQNRLPQCQSLSRERPSGCRF